MVSKKFAAFFFITVLVVMMAIITLLFTLLTQLRTEGEAALLRRLRAQAYGAHVHNANISRSQFAAISAEASASNLYHIGRRVPVFYNLGDEEPKDTIYLHIVQVLNQRSNWKQISTGQEEMWIYTQWMPEEFLMHIPGLNQQYLGLPTGCEIVAFAMLVNKYADVDVFTLIDKMPRSYDPLLGFRGDPFTRGGFTILPPALLDMMEYYMGSAWDMTGASIEDVQAQLATGRPVLAWLRGMFGFNVHVITLTGFNQYGFFYNDPWLGGVNEFMTYEYFLAMWENPIEDLRLNRVHPPRIAMSY